MNILFVPGWGLLGKDLDSDQRRIVSLYRYEDLEEGIFEKYDKIIAHSTGCLYLAEFIRDNDLYRYEDKIILYNPIIESSLFQLFSKRIKSNKLLKWKGLILVCFAAKNIIFHPKAIFGDLKKIISTNKEYKIDLYDKFKNLYLSRNDEFSGEYFEKLKNVKDIEGSHDEVYLENFILNKLINNN